MLRLKIRYRKSCLRGTHQRTLNGGARNTLHLGRETARPVRPSTRASGGPRSPTTIPTFPSSGRPGGIRDGRARDRSPGISRRYGASISPSSPPATTLFATKSSRFGRAASWIPGTRWRKQPRALARYGRPRPQLPAKGGFADRPMTACRADHDIGPPQRCTAGNHNVALASSWDNAGGAWNLPGRLSSG